MEGEKVLVIEFLNFYMRCFRKAAVLKPNWRWRQHSFFASPDSSGRYDARVSTVPVHSFKHLSSRKILKEWKFSEISVWKLETLVSNFNTKQRMMNGHGRGRCQCVGEVSANLQTLSFSADGSKNSPLNDLMDVEISIQQSSCIDM